jgi:hypothetical protein
MVALSQSFTA